MNRSCFSVASGECGYLIRLEDGDRFGPFAFLYPDGERLLKCNMSQDEAQRCLIWDLGFSAAVAAELVVRAEHWSLRRLFQVNSSHRAATT